MKRINRWFLGEYAKKVLLFTLPFIIFQALCLVLFIAKLDTLDLMREQETVSLFLETIGRCVVCLTGGCLILDYMEKRRKANI